MRINVYSQELTNEVSLTTKESNTGIVYHGVRMMLHSAKELHHTPADDDRSAITIWLPRSSSRRDKLADMLSNMAELVRCAPGEKYEDHDT